MIQTTFGALAEIRYFEVVLKSSKEKKGEASPMTKSDS